MKIDPQTLSDRSWAIPAICGLLILHHDFDTPRLSRISRLVWSEAAVDVFAQYGICSRSGDVIDSTEIVLTLHRKGALGIHSPRALAGEKLEALLPFLVGEVLREAERWRDDMRCWIDNDTLDPDRASILSIVSALVAHPFQEMDVWIEKSARYPACVLKARLSSESTVIEITPAGLHGVTLCAPGDAAPAQPSRRYQARDMRQHGTQVATRRARFLKGASRGVRKSMMLPLEVLLYLCEIKRDYEMSVAADWVEYLPASVVDASAGEGLSALYN